MVNVSSNFNSKLRCTLSTNFIILLWTHDLALRSMNSLKSCADFCVCTFLFVSRERVFIRFSISVNLKKRGACHSNITIRSIGKCDTHNHLFQYFSCPFLPPHGHFVSFLLRTKRVILVVICWAEKWAPTELRRLGFVTVWLHRTSGELKYRMTELRKTCVIFHMFFPPHDFSKNTSRGTDREGDTKYVLHHVLKAHLNKDLFILNATLLLMSVPA